MNFKQLKAFDTVMRLGSITGAAKELRVSQPSVTRLIHELETNLGFTLFIRRGRGIVATVEARRFHQAVESAFLNIERLNDLAATIRQTTVGKVSVGVIPTFSTSLLPNVLGELRKQQDGIHTTIFIHNTPAIVESVRLNQFDLGIVSRSPPYEGVHSLYQAVVNYVALIPENHILGDSEDVLDLEEIAGKHEFVTFGNVYPLEMQGMDKELAAQLQHKARYSVANILAAAALVRAANVPALVEPFSARMSAASGGVVIRPLRQKLIYHIGIITRGLEAMTRETRQLADALINTLEDDPIIRNADQS